MKEEVCGRVKLALRPPQDYAPEPPAAQVPGPAPAPTFERMIIRYLNVSVMTKENRDRLETASQYVNKEVLKDYVQSPRRKDGRYPRMTNNATGLCDFPERRGTYEIPPEYLMPCMARNGTYIPEEGVPRDPTHFMNKSMDERHSLITFYNIERPCTASGPAKAHAVVCNYDRTTYRPTHGLIMFCFEPKDRPQEEVNQTLLHESIPVMTFDLR